jgi:hypothetical protein
LARANAKLFQNT